MLECQSFGPEPVNVFGLEEGVCVCYVVISRVSLRCAGLEGLRCSVEGRVRDCLIDRLVDVFMLLEGLGVEFLFGRRVLLQVEYIDGISHRMRLGIA